jgi:hypothetical protein
MKIVIRSWLLLVLLCAAFPADADDKEVYDVSIIRLIASPKEYAHKTVRVMGFLNIAFEGDAIYLHEEDFRRGLLNNGLGIRAEPEIRKRLEKLTDRYVLIEGVVDASFSNVVAVSTFRISLTNITRADAWKVGPGTTPPP